MDIARWRQRHIRLYVFTVLPLVTALFVWLAAATIDELAVEEQRESWLAFAGWFVTSVVLVAHALAAQLRVPVAQRRPTFKQAQNIRWLVFVPAFFLGRSLADTTGPALFVFATAAGACTAATIVLALDSFTGRFSNGIPWGARRDPDEEGEAGANR